MNNYIGKLIKVQRPTFTVEMKITEVKNITKSIISVSGIANSKHWTFTMTLEDLQNNIL